VADYTERITLSSNVAQVAREAEGALDKVAASLGKVREKSLDINLASKTAQLAAAEKAVTAEISKQVDLEAKLATFDAARVRKNAELEAQLAKMNKAATAGVGGPAQAQGGIGGLLGLSESAGGAIALGGAFVAALGAIGAVYEKVASVALDITVAASKFAIAASDFRTEATEAFTKMYGSAAIADGLYDKIVALTVRTGQSKEHFIEEARKLAAAGFNANEVPKILQSLADYEKVKGAGSGDKIEKLLEKINAADKFDAKSVTALAKQGISTAAVYDVLEKKLGKTRAQVEAMVKAGQIKGDVGIDAVLETMDKKFGGAAKIDSVGGFLVALKTQFEGLFDKVDTGPIKEALKNVSEVLGGPGGAELKGELTNTINALFHALFDPFRGPDGAKKIEAAFHTISAGLRAVRGVIEAVGPYFGKLVDFFASIGGSGDIDSGTAKVNLFASSVLDLLGILTGLGPLGEFLDTILNLENFEAPDLSSLGSDMIDGIIQGIESGASSLIESMVSAVTGAVDAAKSALGIASPSKVFEQIGNYSSLGMAKGIDLGAPAANDAAASLGGGAASSAARAYGPGSGGAGGGALGGGAGSSGPSVYNFAIHMPPGATDGAAVGREAFAEFDRHARRRERDRRERDAA
jgi:hypothetical protein